MRENERVGEEKECMFACVRVSVSVSVCVCVCVCKSSFPPVCHSKCLRVGRKRKGGRERN